MEQKNLFQSPLVAAAAVAAIGIVAASMVGAYTLYAIKASQNIITVTGSAEREIKSDTVKWVTSFSRTATVDEVRTASAQMQQDLSQITSYLKKQGLSDSEVTIQPMTTSQVCEGSGNISYDRAGTQFCGSGRVTGYTLQQSILIQSQNVEKATTLSTQAPAAITGMGIIFTSQNVEYYYSKLADVKIEMLSEATQNAKLRADKIAQSSGGKIGALQSAAMGVFQITALNSADIADYGSYDTSSLQKKIVSTVRASFSVR